VTVPVFPSSVRHDAETSRVLLLAYVSGGRYGPRRVPRGMDRALVETLLRGALGPDASRAAFRRALDVALFYEAEGSLEAFVRPLGGSIVSAEDLARAAIGIQAAGDLGTRDTVTEAARALDVRLASHEKASEVFSELLAARLALTPAGSDAATLARIRTEVARAQRHEEETERAMMAYEELAAIERNDVPRMQAQAAEKSRLALLSPAERAPSLVGLYLGVGRLGGLYLQTWAARVLRRDVIQGTDPRPVFAELEQHAAAADPRAEGVRAWFRVVRAAQAIVYLGGTPSPTLKQRWDEGAAFGGQSFLWDDP
jgi:hypothetical protein